MSCWLYLASSSPKRNPLWKSSSKLAMRFESCISSFSQLSRRSPIEVTQIQIYIISMIWKHQSHHFVNPNSKREVLYFSCLVFIKVYNIRAMAWLDKVKELEYPQAGKYVIFIMLLLELSVSVYLLIASQDCLKAILLSVGLLVASFITLVSCGLSIPIQFYFKHWILYNIIGLLSLVGRTTMLVWIMILNF